MPEVSVVLVNYRTEAHVLAVLGHLADLRREEPIAQIVVVDNSPEGGLGSSLGDVGSDVAYVASPANVGFAGGVNLGLSLANREIIVLLNPDARPESGCLAGLVDVLARNSRAVVAGPRLVPFEPGEPLVPSATKRDPGFLAPLVEYTPVRRVVGREWLARHYFLGPEGVEDITPCAMVQGACFAFKRQWLDLVGSFDADRFFMYWEETDFCRRVRLAGGLVLYCPDLACRHLGGASLAGQRGHDVDLFWRSFYAFQSKHHGSLHALLLKIFLGAGLAAEYVLCLAKHRRRGTSAAPELVAYLEAVRLRLAVHLGAQSVGR